MKKILKNKSGLGFIEVVIALGVMITGVISGLTLTFYNMIGATASENKLVAVNLARETIEVVRSFRDSNWLSGQTWNNGILAPGKNSLVPNFDTLTTSWSLYSLDFDSIDNCSGVGSGDCLLWYDSISGMYLHKLGSFPANMQATNFSRLLNIQEICFDLPNQVETVKAIGQQCVTDPLIGWQLKVTVSWVDNQNAKYMLVIEKIYDWR